MQPVHEKNAIFSAARNSDYSQVLVVRESLPANYDYPEFAPNGPTTHQ